MRNILIRVLIMLAIYFGLMYFGGTIGQKILYPIRLMVTFLHELGHGLGALFTGGSVREIQINADGSGYATTAGGSRAIILMGGYIGSAILGNLLFYIGTRSQKLIRPTIYLLSAAMVFTAFFWYNSLFTTTVLIIFAIALGFIALKTNFGKEILMFFGLACILYIIQDFNVGPSSDLAAYAQTTGLFTVQIWKYIWLVIVIIIFLFNIRLIFKK